MRKTIRAPAECDVAIIGAGPGGYVAGVRAAQLGLSAVVIEKDRPGGVCLNWGCIPSKNLIHQAELFLGLREIEAIGVRVDRKGFDYQKVHAGSRAVTETLANGVSALLKKNKVTLVKGTARVLEKGRIGLDDGAELRAKNIIIATGSRPMEVPGFEFDGTQVLSSNGILALKDLPKSLIVLGGGAIGCEFAFVMNAFGVDVTLVELAEHILPFEDFETVRVLEKSFKKAGVKILVGQRAIGLTKGPDGVKVEVEDAEGKQRLHEAEKALVVFGRTPNSRGIGLENAGVMIDAQGFVQIGDHCQTDVPGIYAIGDLTRTPALAHVASREAEIAVEHIAGISSSDASVDASLVPSAVYTEPQIAGIGLREDEALRDGIAVKKSVFPYVGAGKSVAVGKPEGLVKILCDPDTEEILGAHVVGHNATEMIHELLIAKQCELLPEDIARVTHAHPTLSEAIMEAARGIGGAPIHA